MKLLRSAHGGGRLYLSCHVGSLVLKVSFILGYNPKTGHTFFQNSRAWRAVIVFFIFLSLNRCDLCWMHVYVLAQYKHWGWQPKKNIARDGNFYLCVVEWRCLCWQPVPFFIPCVMLVCVCVWVCECVSECVWRLACNHSKSKTKWPMYFILGW